MSKKIGLGAVLNARGKGKEIPAMQLIRNDPDTAAIMAKLVRAREKTYINSSDPRGNANIDQGSLHAISNTIKSSTSDAENMMQLFPDTELAAQILISSIISPKDMMSTEIIYRLKKTFLTADIVAALISATKDYCEQHYEITKLLPLMLRDVLFEKGSHVIAVIPEAAVDDLINGKTMISKESISEILTVEGAVVPLGLLGPPKAMVGTTDKHGLSIEAFNSGPLSYNTHDSGIKFSAEDSSSALDNLVTVTDNFQVLKLPGVISTNNRVRVGQKIRAKHLATESTYDARKLESSVYKNTKTGMRTFTTIKTSETASRKSIGMPLVMTLPSESVIPLHVPGDEKKHIGYFILTDEEGNPVSKHSNEAHMAEMTDRLGDQGNQMSSALIGRAKKNLMGNKRQTMVTDAAKIYSDIVENDLLARIKNGVYGRKAELGKSSDVFRIMLARTLANQYTKLVYIPAELVTYFAYKYNPNGVGKSLLDDMGLLNSLRAMSMFGRVMASLKNSIGVTEVKLKLDERDPDPEKSIETAVHEIMKSRQHTFPLGINAPMDIVDWVQKSQYEFSFEGHPRVPDMNFEFTQKGANTVKPDTDLDAELNKRSIMSFGLSPETVDNGFAAEFATTSANNNILLSKRVLQIQEVMIPLMSSHAGKLIVNDANLCEILIGILKESADAVKKSLTDEEQVEFADNEEGLYTYLIEEFAECIELGLPNPNSTTLENQMLGFDAYIGALDKCIESFVSADLLNSEFAGDVGNYADSIKGVVKAYYVRKYLADNNILPELGDLTATDEDGNPKLDIFDMQKEHVSGIIRSAVKFIKGLGAMRDGANVDLGGAGADDGSSSMSGDGGSSTEEPTDDGSGLGGGGDLLSQGTTEPESDDANPDDEGGVVQGDTKTDDEVSQTEPKDDTAV